KKSRADVVTLYAGGQYHLYTCKKYEDIRIVFAPEKQAAFYGGDPDNFEYPRFDLDVAFFRVYEGGKPIKCEHYLKWSAAGSKEDELVFVSGHPGRTNRANSVDELKFIAAKGKHDTDIPWLGDAQKAYDQIAKAQTTRAELTKQVTVLENGGGFNCSSFSIAPTLLRASEELPKPNTDRLREFADARLD